ncbi:MAG: tetratricopeptide repeat protein [Anaerolineae bacterium]|jgi:tetratricopeptide (TPR) repeat protein
MAEGRAGDGQASGGALSTTETQRIIRQRLGPVARRWGLRSADLEQLARQMDAVTYAPGETVLPRGVHADCLGLVVRGQVAVHVGRRTSTRVAVVLLPGNTFGEMMLAESRPNYATLQAVTPCEIRFLRRAAVQAVGEARRAERQTAALWRLIRSSALVLAVVILLLLLLQLSPARQTLAMVPLGLGQWCSQQGRENCTLKSWQAAAQLTPADPNPLLALGTYYYRQGEVAAAERSFEAAGALDSDLPEVHNNLGLIYAHQGEHERAVTAFERALALEPGIAATEHNLAASLQALGRYDEALQHYRAALALDEPQVSALANMAIAYYEAGEPEQAAEVAQQALAYDEEMAPAHVVLGAVALELRQPEQALAHLQRAIELEKGLGQAYFFLGLTYKALDLKAEAVVAFEQALALAGDEVTRVRIRRHLNELYQIEERNGTP